MKWVLAILISFLLLALPAQASRDMASRTQTIRLISAGGKSRTLVDRPPKGTLSPGDVFTESSILRNAVPQFGRANGAVVGSDFATFKLLSAKRADVKESPGFRGHDSDCSHTYAAERALSRRRRDRGLCECSRTA